MKNLRVCFWLLVGTFFLFPASSSAADTNLPPRLTFELRDGSRVIGISTQKELKFNSALLGEIRLDIKNIRSIECLSSNSARLLIAGGDTLTASLADSKLSLKTSFGKVELAVASIRRIIVVGETGFSPQHDGLVALWRAEGNANDATGKHDGIVQGRLEYGNGLLGQAFQFDSDNTWIKIPASTNLDVGKGSGFTLEAWVNPSEINRLNPVFEWNDLHRWAVHFSICPNQPHHPSGRSGPGELYADIVDDSGEDHKLSSLPFVAQLNQFQHIVLTYDAGSGAAMIYHNAKVVARQNLGIFTPQTKDDLYLGSRPAPAGERDSFAGLLDEAAVYSRALTAEEIRQDYNAGRNN